MLEIVVTVLGIALSVVYVGYLAFAIKSIPLWIIVIATFALAVREFVVEFRSEAKRDTRNESSADPSK